MAVREALQFIERVGRDERLRGAVERLAETADGGGVLELARREGLTFDLEELRRAHRHDWSMRARHYSARRATE